TGRTGEVCIRGPIVMKGYWNKPEATAEAIDEEGWLHTGDIGFLDDEGFLTITDRKKDMIIRGGENVYCVEIENRLVEHPAIADAAVIGVPHPELGEEVKAVVQVEPRHTLTEDEVREWVRAQLADFKVPAHVKLGDGPPAAVGRASRVGAGRARRLRGAGPRRAGRRPAAPRRVGEAAEEGAARRGQGHLRRDALRPGGGGAPRQRRRAPAVSPPPR